MKNYLLVAVGSAIGGMTRFFLSNLVYKFLSPYFPFGTLVVNVIGSFIIGIIIFYLDAQELISYQTRILLTIGFCGGLTTFSTFTYETFSLMKDSEYLLAFLNIILSIILTLSAIFTAFIISKKLFS